MIKTDMIRDFGDRIIDFLETDLLRVIYSDRGLQSLALGAKLDRSGSLAGSASPENLDSLGEADSPGRRNIYLKAELGGGQSLNDFEQLIIMETVNFLQTGRHELPLDLSKHTDFQQSVFAAVGEIEPGRILTYKDLACLLGKPGAAQAVGGAVAKNPVAYFLPTHRVLPVKGLGICRSGAGHLREKLLAHEGHDLEKLRGNYLCTRKKCIQHI